MNILGNKNKRHLFTVAKIDMEMQSIGFRRLDK